MPKKGEQIMTNEEAQRIRLKIGLERVFGKHNQVDKDWVSSKQIDPALLLQEREERDAIRYRSLRENSENYVNSGLEKGDFPRLADIWFWIYQRSEEREPEQQALLNEMRIGKNREEWTDIYNYSLDLFTAEKHIEGSDKISCQIYKTLQDNRAKGIKRSYIDIYCDLLEDWEEREKFSMKNSIMGMAVERFTKYAIRTDEGDKE
jgi:hypothetical protein